MESTPVCRCLYCASYCIIILPLLLASIQMRAVLLASLALSDSVMMAESLRARGA